MMKRINIVVEGQTEQEFVNSVLAPYFRSHNVYGVTPILIRTSKTGRGGLVNYQHLANTIDALLKTSTNDDFVVTTFVDFFRIPKNMPQYASCMTEPTKNMKVEALESAMAEVINDRRFVPYIQLHEFEALLFSSNDGFEYYFKEKHSLNTKTIVESFDNPEDINSSPEGAPSKRILKINKAYDKVIEGNLIAMEIGLPSILKRCPRFKIWLDALIDKCKEQ